MAHDDRQPGDNLAQEIELQIKYRLVEQLAASEQKYRELIESIREMAFKCDEDFKVTFANRAWTETLGHETADVTGRLLLDFVATDDRPRAREALAAGSSARVPELRVIGADGSVLWCELAVRVVEGEGRVGSLYNIDARKRARDELTQLNDELLRTNSALEIALRDSTEAERLKTEFLSSISHELRTPLNAIANLPALLGSDIQDRTVWQCSACQATFELHTGEASVAPTVVPCKDCGQPLEHSTRPLFVGDAGEHRHFLNTMRLSARHLLNVVNDVLDFSRLDANRMPFVFSEVDLPELLSDMEISISPLSREKRIGIKYAIDDSTPRHVRADPVKLTQILVNLVGNAIKFTPAEGRIEVLFSPSEDAGIPVLHCEVRDTGEGIPSDQLETIFESFRQVDGGATRRHGGTGLGLSITKKLVEGHGGRIWVSSEVNEGSVFTFVIPFAPLLGKQRAADLAAVPGQAPAGQRQRVLVIDDREDELQLAKLAFEREGSFEAVLLDRPEAAIEMVKLHGPACIILDVLMPHENGLSVLRRLKQDPLTREVPILVTTAYRVSERVVQALGAHWFPKPWDATQLVAKVWSLTKQPLAASMGVDR